MAPLAYIEYSNWSSSRKWTLEIVSSIQTLNLSRVYITVRDVTVIKAKRTPKQNMVDSYVLIERLYFTCIYYFKL